jgi:hypothetical protein
MMNDGLGEVDDDGYVLFTWRKQENKWLRDLCFPDKAKELIRRMPEFDSMTLSNLFNDCVDHEMPIEVYKAFLTQSNFCPEISDWGEAPLFNAFAIFTDIPFNKQRLEIAQMMLWRGNCSCCFKLNFKSVDNGLGVSLIVLAHNNEQMLQLLMSHSTEKIPYNGDHFDVDDLPSHLLIAEYKLDWVATARKCRLAPHVRNPYIAHLYAMVKLIQLGTFRIKEGSNLKKFVYFMDCLPYELQMLLCHRVYGSMEDDIPTKRVLWAIKYFFICNGKTMLFE